jgi:hypothetical protein
MSTEEGIRLGLRAAASHLEDTAADFDEMAKRKESVDAAYPSIPGLAARLKGEIAALREKAQLLRAQAAQVRELKVSRGR